MCNQYGRTTALFIIAIVIIVAMGMFWVNNDAEAKMQDGSLTVYTTAKVFTVEMDIEHIRMAVCK